MKVFLVLVPWLFGAAGVRAQPRLLVFSGQPDGIYHHDAIDWGIQLLKTLAPKGGFAYDTTTNVASFTDANLAKYDAVLMNCNCRHTRMFSQPQRDALQKFVRSGKGWAATHCAAAVDLDINWQWYVDLVGAVHRHHTDGSQPGILKVEETRHPSMTHFTNATWNIPKEELYFFLKNPAPGWTPNSTLPKVNVLLTFQSWGDGQTLPPAGNKRDSSSLGAMAWYHEFEGGRAWYTGLGHENWLYQDSLYIKHVLGGLKYVLRLDGSSGLVRPAPYLAPARTAFSFRGSASQMAGGYRRFDIRGAGLREIDSETDAFPAAFAVSIGLPRQ